MSKHKKQHFVPACYSKAWKDPDSPQNQTPYIWIFDKDGSNPRRKAPENAFHETDLYTISGPDGDRNLVLEKGLCQLEYEFNRVRNSKLNFRRELSPEDQIVLCAFAAAAQVRTPAMRDHQREQFRRPLEMMEKMTARLDAMTEEEKTVFISRQPPSLSEKSSGLDYQAIKAMHETPLQMLLAPMVQTLTPLLCKLDMALLLTDDDIGFITSDHPCVWFDPEGYKRPPMYRSPALIYETIEITLPLSPSCMLMLNRQGVSGYIEVDRKTVTELNRRTRGFASDYFVVHRNHVEPIWLDEGKEPDDSWDKLHPRPA